MELERATFRSSARVDENVHVGGYLAAADPGHVRARGFTHILKMFADDPRYEGGRHRHPGVRYLVIDAEDVPEYSIDRDFARCLEFIQAAIRERGQILVHCHAGISRSVTIVLLHLVVNSGLRLADAWAIVKKARPVARPNPGFWEKLVDVDERASRFRLEGRAPAAAIASTGAVANASAAPAAPAAARANARADDGDRN